MKPFIFFLTTLPFLLGAQNNELLNRLKLQIAEERIRVIKNDADLSNLNERLVREHKKLARALAEHPQIKDSKLNAQELTALKLKLLKNDEDLNDRRLNNLKLHRSFEAKLLKNKILKRLYSQLDFIKKRK